MVKKNHFFDDDNWFVPAQQTKHVVHSGSALRVQHADRNVSIIIRPIPPVFAPTLS